MVHYFWYGGLKMKKLTTILIYLLAISVFCNTAWANLRVPTNPQTVSECDSFDEQMKTIGREKWANWDQLYEQSKETARQRSAACSGGKDYLRCSAPYDQRIRQIYAAMDPVKRDHDAFQQQRHSLNMQCRTTARANEQRAAQEKQQLEQQQRLAHEQQRRQQDAARESESRQRQAQLEQDRAQREFAQRQQQTQADADRQRQAADIRQRQQEQQRQQDVQRQQDAQRQQIAESQRQQLAVAQQQLANLTRQNTQPNTISDRSASNSLLAAVPATSAALPSVSARPSDPVAISPPVRTAIDAAKNAVEINGYRKDAKEVASDPSQLPVKAAEYAVDASNDARRNSLDRILNPRGDSSERMNISVAAATRSNSQIQEARFGEEGKLISQVGNDAISGVGSVANRVLGDFDRAMAQANNATPNNTAVVASVSRPIASLQVPTSHSSGGYAPTSISPPTPSSYSIPGAATSAAVPTVSSLDALNNTANRPNANSGSTNNPPSVQGTTDLSALLGGTSSPKRICAGLLPDAQSACLIKQCTTLQYANHSECKGLPK